MRKEKHVIRLLSRGGRATLCKSVLSNLPTYYMSLFLMPEKVISILERILRNFFWEGNKGSKLNHLVKWNMVIRALSKGGLGFGGLKSKIGTPYQMGLEIL